MDKSLRKIIKIICILVIVYMITLTFPVIKTLFEFVIKLLLPFIIGFIGAYILYPLAEKISNKRVNYKASVIIVVIFFMTFITLFVVILFPKIYEQIKFLIDNLPNYIDEISKYIDKICNFMSFLPDKYLPNKDNLLTFFTNFINTKMNNYEEIFDNLSFYIILLFLSPVLIVYFLFEFPKIRKFLKEKTLDNNKIEWYNTLKEIDESMRIYFKGLIIVNVVLALLATFLFEVIGIELPLLWGSIIGFTNIIPYIGPYIGGFLVCIFAMTSSFNKAISCLIVVVLLQLVESNLISPNIHSKNTHTSPIIVLLFITFLGEIMGIFGLVIAVPILNIFQILLSKIKILKN